MQFHSKYFFDFRGPASKIIVKFCIAVSCGILGAIFTFPGLRMARMHWDSLKYCSESLPKRLILNTSFVLPFLIVILWIKPISREYLTNRAFAGMDHPLYDKWYFWWSIHSTGNESNYFHSVVLFFDRLTPQAFDLIRFLLIIIAVILRLALMPIYLQAYLNLAHDRLEDQKKEAGRITNVDLQKKVQTLSKCMRHDINSMMCLPVHFRLHQYFTICVWSHCNM